MGTYIVTALFLFLASSAFAMDGCGAGTCSKCHSLSLKEANELLREVGEVKKVDASPVNGLWLVDLEKDGRKGVVFLDFGKKNLIAGTVFPLAPAKQTRQESRPAASTRPSGATVDVASIPLENSIVLGNPLGKKRLFVFTDPDCPFCGKMHGELKNLVTTDPELAVYLKLFPSKLHPAAYDKARLILGRNSLVLLEKAFAGEAMSPKGADYAKKGVDQTLAVGDALGITSTPTIVFPDGRIVAGFKAAAELNKMLAEGGRQQ